MSSKHVIAGSEAMHQFARNVASKLAGGEILLLLGELGAGKTTFTQGLARALGVAQDVTSPTFTIISEYMVTNHPTITTLVHVDLYRLDSAHVEGDMMIQEVIETAGESYQVTVIEWADRLKTLPPAGKRLAFTHGSTSQERVVEVS